MPPSHAALFNAPVRFVIGAGAAAGLAWYVTIGPKAAAEFKPEEEAPKRLVRLPSGNPAPGLYGAESPSEFGKRIGVQK
eukprot:CAMPEP_0119300230 /NCGR_PEP_ID=MMETSP1333-20130426/2207_1 /TAXON_ID=418940 /ORGANISM="Scyphosphaera apsteinii, Strain RCC1455" /LENGTH=78 /DNA_ID=CAMNT_0007301935 /DNA_START=70 /DNA_END=306 /DNA_ORIENTATION=+